MESNPSIPHNDPRLCYKTESRPKDLHQEATVPPDVRGGKGTFLVKKGGKSIDSPMQTKTTNSTVIPSTPPTLAPASASASPNASRTLLVPAAGASSITSAMILQNKNPDKHAVGTVQGTTLSAETSEHKLKYSREGELKSSDKNFSKTINKTTTHTSATRHLQKSLQKTTPAVVVLPKSVQQTSLSQVPRTMSSPKLRSSPTPTTAVDRAESYHMGRSNEMIPLIAHKLESKDNRACVMEHSQEMQSVQPLEKKEGKIEILQRDKDEENNRDRKEEEGILTQVGCSLKGSDITLQMASKCPFLPPGATTISTSQVKKTASRTGGNAMPQERECEREKRKDWKEGIEGREALEKISGHKEIEQDKKTEEKIEKERIGQDRNSKAKEKEKEEKEIEESKKLNKIKSFKDSATVTEDNPVPVQTLDAALQTDLLYEDAEIQAVVEVSNKSSSMSPNMTYWSQMDPMANLSNHEKVSGTASMGIQNGLGQDISLDSAPIIFASDGPMAKGLSPTAFQSFICSKPTRQHVCEIQIELRSQSTISDSLALPEEEESQPSPTRSGPEREPKQVDKEGNQAETGPLPEVAWDEQGMTWEVYGAAVDMESLGFAIQNHLQHKIQEHEQHIGHLRKSISLSEHSNSDGKRGRNIKKKRNAFRSLFQTSTCCLKIKSEA